MTSYDESRPGHAEEPGDAVAPPAGADAPATPERPAETASASAPDKTSSDEALAQTPAEAEPAMSADQVRIEHPDAETAGRKPMSVGAIITVGVLVAILLSAIVGFAAGFLGAFFGIHANPVLPDRVTVISPTTQEPVAAAASAILGSVVNVDVSGGSPATGLPSGHPSVPSQGNGSGVAFKRAADGGTYVLTNNHVVEGAAKISVTDPTGISQPAKLVGADSTLDIAVIKVAEKLPLAQLGDSDKLTVGQMAVAIGSPFGLQHSVTSGVVSAIHRALSGSDIGQSGNLLDVIQTDAAINPGNSGGALVDRTGRLIGINTAIFSSSGSSSGIGFAIPVNTAVRTAEDLIATGKARHPFLGIEGQSVDASLTAQKNLPVTYGAYVVRPLPGTGAEKAGIKAGDVIVKVDDRDIRSMPELQAAVRALPVGSTVTVELYRGGAKKTLTMTVGDQPKQ